MGPGKKVGEEVASFVDDGFDAVKIRTVGEDGFSIENTVRRLEAAREAIGPDGDLMVDAHGSLDVGTAIRLSDRMEEFDVLWFEEPVSPDDHSGTREVRRATTIPVASGESEFTKFEFRDLFDRDALDVAQPDVARVGGIMEMVRIAAMATARGVRLSPHCWGCGVLVAASLHAALAVVNCHLFEIGRAKSMPLLYNLFEESFDIRDGRVHAPTGPGLGFTLRSNVEERFPYESGPEDVP
jgi:L-alanine-DL-glutamate epimerase-like enolase superfamily enzyme